MYHHNRGNRRHVCYREAIRKRNICLEVYHNEWYDNLHEYSKNKVHCSCPMCAAKTRGYYYMGGKYHPPISDIRKTEYQDSEILDFQEGRI